MRFDGEKLQALRVKKGINQTDAAGQVGIDRNTYLDYERFRWDGTGPLYKPDPRRRPIIEAMAKFYGVWPAELLVPDDGEAMPDWALPPRIVSLAIPKTTFARLLDRRTQWGELHAAVAERRPGVILMTGEENQSMYFFLERLIESLGEGERTSGGPGIYVALVSLALELEALASVQSWIARFEDAIRPGRASARRSHLAELRRPTLLLLGHGRSLRWLEEEEWDALERLLCDHYFRWVSSCPHPVTLFIPLEGEGQEFETRVRSLGSCVRSDRRLRLWTLTPLHLPTWEEIRTYVDDDHEPLPGRPAPVRHLLERMEAEYMRRTARDCPAGARPIRTFEQVVTFVDQYLH